MDTIPRAGSDSYSTLSVATWNCAGFTGPWQYSHDIVNQHDITVLTEHWLDERQCATYFSDFCDYTPFYCVSNGMNNPNRVCGQGGVCILVHNSLSPHIVRINTVSDCLVVLRVSLPGAKPFVLVGAYMPANCHREQDADSFVECCSTIRDIVEEATECMSDYMIVGDLNSDYGPLQGYTRHGTKTSSFGKISLDLLINSQQMTICDLTNLCTGPTVTFRSRSSSGEIKSSSYIDHIVGSRNIAACMNFGKVFDFEETNTSDHAPVSCTFSLPVTVTDSSNKIRRRAIFRTRYDFASDASKAAFTDMLDELLSNMETGLSVSDNCTTSDIDVAVDRCVTAITTASTACFPSKRVQLCRPRKQNYCQLQRASKNSVEVSDAKCHLSKAHSAWELAGKPTGPADERVHLVHAQRQLRRAQHFAARSAHISYLDQLVRASKSGSPWFWRQLRDDPAEIPKEMEKKLNEHYSTIYKRPEDVPECNEYLQGLKTKSGDVAPKIISASHVHAASQKLKKGKAADENSLLAEHLQFLPARAAIFEILSKIFTAMRRVHHVPDSLCSAVLSPLLKSNSKPRDSCSNYRAIAVIPLLAKVWESTVIEEIRCSLHSSNLQFGFQRGMGTEGPYYVAAQVTKHYTTKGSKVHALSIDLSKAFDCILHDKLMDALSATPLDPHLIFLLRDYHLRATAVTKIGSNYVGPHFSLERGCKQGSLLSPFLFNFYIAPLLNKLTNGNTGCIIGQHHIPCVAYADDILLLSPSKYLLSKAFDICKSFFTSVGLSVNFSKCVYIVCTSKGTDRNSELRTEDLSLLSSESLSLLGMPFPPQPGVLVRHFKCRLWSANSRMRRYGLLCRNVPLYITRHVWKAICSPCIFYGVFTLCFIQINYIFSLDRIFRHVVRSLLGVDNRLRSHNVYSLFNCTSILNLVLYKCLTIFNNFCHSKNYILCFLVQLCGLPFFITYAHIWFSTPSPNSILSFKYSKESFNRLRLNYNSGQYDTHLYCFRILNCIGIPFKCKVKAIADLCY